MKPWKVRLPLLVSLCYVPFSFAALVRLPMPTMHEADFYFTLYSLVNLPVCELLELLPEALYDNLLGDTCSYRAVFWFGTISLFFWAAISMTVGAGLDFVWKRKNKLVS